MKDFSSEPGVSGDRLPSLYGNGLKDIALPVLEVQQLLLIQKIEQRMTSQTAPLIPRPRIRGRH